MSQVQNELKKPKTWQLLTLILAPDRRFFVVLLSYSIAISVLALGLPISVQSLINSVVNTVMFTPLLTLALVLFTLLALSSVLRGLNALVSEYFQRHFFSRLSTEITLRSIYTPYYEFEAINKNLLMNKFFEIVTIQKALPYLITGGFSITLQTIAGVILSSLYHPFYLVFNVVLLVLLYLVWKTQYGSAAMYSIEESNNKHRLAVWLQEIGRSHHLFKTQRSKVYASYKSNRIIEDYIEARKGHFRHLFLQISFLLILYAIGNSILLFISGLLVLREELTLGQLVATEIIFSGIFVNFYRAGDYLESFYDVVASCDKLKAFYNHKLESIKGKKEDITKLHVQFKDAKYKLRGQKASVNLNMTFEPGKRYVIGTASSSYKTLVRDSILGFVEPEDGFVIINGLALDEYNVHTYRNAVSLIDSQGVLECTVREFMTFGLDDVSDAKIVNAFHVVKLYDKFKRQGIDLDTVLLPSGYPLSRTDTFRLKIARSILENPKFVIINDYLSEIVVDQIFFNQCTSAYSEDTTVILLDNDVEKSVPFDEVMYLDQNGFTKCDDIEEMNKHVPHK